MALETANICDGCNKSLDEGNEIYCYNCLEELKATIRELEDELSALKNA